MKYSLYILRLADDRLYVGISKDPQSRLEYHRNSKGAKFTKHLSELKLVHIEEYPNLLIAMQREKSSRAGQEPRKKR